MKTASPVHTKKRATYLISRWLFLRLLGLIYLVAFISLWTQVHGLIGRQGILPAGAYLNAALRQLGEEAYLRLPTLCWFGASDACLSGLCAVGTILSLLLVVGMLPKLVLVGLWAVYLSLSVVGQVFLSFQWDTLLLETGFFAIFYAPMSPIPGISREKPPSDPARWLLWWLLFKLMFLSGVTKLLSGDPTWRDLTTLTLHYQTQPIPNWISWYAHQLLEMLQKASVVLMFIVELVVPCFIFSPRILRHLACALLLLFQISIEITGNYGFFNLLTIVLCIALLDDQLLRRLTPGRWTAWLPPGPTAIPADIQPSPDKEAPSSTEPDIRRVGHVSTPSPTRQVGWQLSAIFIGAMILLWISILTFLQEMVRSQDPATLPKGVVASLNACDKAFLSWGDPWVLRRTRPLRTINGYGLFRVMTTERPEIVIEGSRDGTNWVEYSFHWKPGNVQRPPRFVAPHMPRLDWQMWFAALRPSGARWLAPLMYRLLEGSEEVLDLLDTNPFPDDPPRIVRLVYYRQYEFTDFEEKRATGAWWRRTERQVLSEELSLTK